MMDKML